MGLMGGGLWGVGFAIVDMRIRKLLKRFMATPMKRSHFLMGMMVSRLVFMIPQIVVLLVFSYLLFGVRIYGNWFSILFIVLIGAVEFAAIGLLVASRAQTLETASGLMNLVMLPMWTLSGIFFSYERFPEIVQPLIRWLPLTPVIDSLRALMMDGKPISTLGLEIVIILVWTVVPFTLALAIFRWND
jgi:ABC-type polysaccharide/polyol phosphate export permease